MDKQDGCQQTDADVFCRLALCDEMAYAVTYKETSVSNVPGFSCPGVASNYGNWVGFVDVHLAKDMKAAHGAGKVVSNVQCSTSSKYVLGRIWCSFFY